MSGTLRLLSEVEPRARRVVSAEPRCRPLGDVDANGDVVDRLAGTGLEGQELAGVLRMIEASRALEAAAAARTEGWT
jgi:hypothetical protein